MKTFIDIPDIYDIFDENLYVHIKDNKNIFRWALSAKQRKIEEKDLGNKRREVGISKI